MSSSILKGSICSRLLSLLSILQDLIDDLKSELSGNFERVIIGMMTPTTMYDVHELRRAMKVWKSAFYVA